MIAPNAGTHIDAPYHFGPTSDGQRARTIDDLPLDWFYSDGVVLDFSATKRRGKNSGERSPPLPMPIRRFGSPRISDCLRNMDWMSSSSMWVAPVIFRR